MRTKNIVVCGIATALLCVISPIAIPIYGIPFTLATLVIYITASLQKAHISVISVILYILIGCIGLPVFSGFTAGVGHVLGPGGGFILGYIPLSICISLLNKTQLHRIVGMTAGTVLLYLCGCIGYSLTTGNNTLSVLAVCVIPFIPGDIVKIIIAALAVPRLNAVLRKK